MKRCRECVNSELIDSVFKDNYWYCHEVRGEIKFIESVEQCGCFKKRSNSYILSFRRVLKYSIVTTLLYFVMIIAFYYGEVIDSKILWDLIKFSPIVWLSLYLVILFSEYLQSNTTDEEMRKQAEMSEFKLM